MRRTYAPIQAAIASGVDAVGGPGTQAGERLSVSADFLDFIADEMTAIAERWEEHPKDPAVVLTSGPGPLDRQ